jgi:poly(3-hydroxybutyrate) depolymerase
MRNELVSGELWAHGRRVDLADIRCPLYLLAGAKDHITPPPQVFALADFASTPANEIARATISGGHLGLFMGHEALRGHWAVIFADIARRPLAGLSPDCRLDQDRAADRARRTALASTNAR